MERQRGEIRRVPIWRKQKLLLFPPFVASPSVSGADDLRRFAAEMHFPGSLLLLFQAISPKYTYIYIYIHTHFFYIYIYIYGYIRATPGFALPPAESKGSFFSPSWAHAGGRVCQGWAFVWQHVSKFTVSTEDFQENKRVGGR